MRMTEELLDPKPENQETLRQKRVAHLEEYLATADPEAVVKPNLLKKHNRTRCTDWPY